MRFFWSILAKCCVHLPTSSSKNSNFSFREDCIPQILTVYLHAYWAVNSHARQLWNFFQLSFPVFNVNSFKGFQSDQIQRNSRKIFIAHYAYRNVDLNLTLAKTQRYNIVVTLFRMAEILFQHLNAKNSRCELFRVNINLTDSFFK